MRQRHAMMIRRRNHTLTSNVLLLMILLVLSLIMLGTKNTVHALSKQQQQQQQQQQQRQHQECNDCQFQETIEDTTCTQIMEHSVFDGTCCSLSNVDNASNHGCTLKVANGWCQIQGPYWSKVWNSTAWSRECPTSDYSIPYRRISISTATANDMVPAAAAATADTNYTSLRRRSASAISLLFSIGIATNFTRTSIQESI